MNKKNLSLHLIQLVSIGFLTKSISILSRMILTRFLGQEAIGIYSLVNPILILILTLSSFSLPTAVASLISKNEGKEKIIMYSALSIVIILSLGLIFLLLLFSNTIADTLLCNHDTINSLYASLLIIPLTSISAIIKGYFLGSNELTLASYSQVLEECGRLSFILFCSFFFINIDTPTKASFAIYSLGIGEIFQISCMLLFSKKQYKHKMLNFLKEEKTNFEAKELLKISFPLTLARLIGSITYCLEPIIFTHLMSKCNFPINYITVEYGILNSYVMPLLMIPSFISVSMSNYLIPNIGKFIKEKKFLDAKKLLIKILSFSLIIGIIISLIFLLFGQYILQIVYGEVVGLDYLYKICFFFIIYYIETPIITTLSICSLSSKSLLSTIISSTIRIILLLILVPKFQVMGIAIASLSSIYIDVILNIIFLRIFFKRNNVKFIF